MKKTFSIISITAFSLAMLFNISILTDQFEEKGIDLGSLITINDANAECNSDSNGLFWCNKNVPFRCGGTTWKKYTYFSANGNVLGTATIEDISGAVIEGSIVVGYASSTFVTGSSGGNVLTGRDCPNGWNPFCSVNNPCNDDL